VEKSSFLQKASRLSIKKRVLKTNHRDALSAEKLESSRGTTGNLEDNSILAINPIRINSYRVFVLQKVNNNYGEKNRRKGFNG